MYIVTLIRVLDTLKYNFDVYSHIDIFNLCNLIKMKAALLILVLFVNVFADENVKEMDQAAGDETKSEDKPDMKIEVVHKPNECNDEARKTQRLDILSMKYIGKLEDGTQFEST